MEGVINDTEALIYTDFMSSERCELGSCYEALP